MKALDTYELRICPASNPQAVSTSKVAIGMSDRDVVAALGPPTPVASYINTWSWRAVSAREPDVDGVHVTFKNGRVTTHGYDYHG